MNSAGGCSTMAGCSSNGLRPRGVAPASASAMVKKLAALELAEHARYRGVSLTPAGERVAIEVIRHHRLIELYLAQALGMPWDRVHEEAEVLEHAISPELSELIAAALGNPKRPDLARQDKGDGGVERAEHHMHLA